MRFLLDTHILLWWLADDPLLSKKGRVIIQEEKNIFFVSTATTWEMMIKRTLGKLEVPDNLIEALDVNQFKILPISLQHTLAIKELPSHHHDPFDRMLVAQATCEKLTLVTADEKLSKYDVSILQL